MEVWTAATPNGWKVTIMLEELIEAGLDVPAFEVHTVDLMAGEHRSDEFTAINPNQKIPALVDGDRHIMESCAVMLYLAEKYPSSLLPLGEERWEVLPWLFWQAANVGPTFGNKLSYTRYMDNIDAERKSHPWNVSAMKPNACCACWTNNYRDSPGSAVLTSPLPTSPATPGYGAGSGARSISPVTPTWWPGWTGCGPGPRWSGASPTAYPRAR